MQIETYSGKYDDEIISLILDIQNNESKINLSLEEQPDLLTIHDSYQKNGGEFWIALDQGNVIGTLGLMIKADHRAIMKKFFVKKEYRSQKVGLALYMKLLEFAKEAEVKHIILDTPSVAHTSHRFYEKAGFRKIKTEELPVPYTYPDRNCILYMLDLGETSQMTEWEKLQAGQMYNDFVDDLFQRRIVAKKLFRAYNKTEDEEVEKRNEILAQLLGKVGKNVWIEPDFRCEFGKNIVIEDNVYINFGCVTLDCAEVVIGANTLLGPNIGIYPVNHAIDAEERIKGGCSGKPVRIGKNVWLGGDVKILAGVTIGDNTIIGAGSVVPKDIPENVIAVGNPCKVLREITEADKTDYLKNAETW